MRVSVLNGPNLNLLGTREPTLYGTDSLADIEARVREKAAQQGIEVDWRQTNHEGEFVEIVQGLSGRADGAVVNAAAFTHTSWAVRDAFLSVPTPFVEVHLSNIFAREEFRRNSFVSPIALGVISGFGPMGYGLGLNALLEHLEP